MKKKKLLIFIITYKASFRLLDVYNQIPFKNLKKYKIKVLISDDKSGDDTIKYAQIIYKKNRKIKLNFNKKNLGYGGNIKYCLNYALKNKFNYAVMIHGDNQYSPKNITKMIKIFELHKHTHAVTGSRILGGVKKTLEGRMPFYKLFGNILQTKFQNLMLNTRFSDSHSGLWAYRIKSLSDKMYKKTTNGFNFDQQMRFQYIYKEQKISETPINTRYADERSQLHIIYAIRFFFETVIFFLMKIKLLNIKRIKYL